MKILPRFTGLGGWARGQACWNLALLAFLALSWALPRQAAAHDPGSAGWDCADRVGYGPLRLTSQSPFQSLRLGLAQQAPSTLERGQLEVHATGTWTNTWANGLAGGKFFLDYETLTGSLGLAYGWSDRVQISIGLEDRSRFGGSLDGLVQGFHDALGIRQDGRDEHPRDRLALRLAPDGGEPAVDFGAEATGSFSRSIALSVQHTLTCGGPKMPALSYAVTTRWGAGGEDFESRGEVDLGISVAAAHRWRRWHGYLTVGHARFNQDRYFGIQLRNSQYSALGAIEWRRRPRSSVVVQWLHRQGAARGFEPFTKSTNEVSLGWKREVARQGVLEIGLIENVITFENSADFGIHFGYTHRFACLARRPAAIR